MEHFINSSQQFW